ncbi:MAG: hypothetical protein JO064_11480 [Actinobacteria bacterium]|nr:hypothetical protein [Actinomycetota bacterium]MBV8396865.1 hypothetical protein [Actinomycetota bacterium]MBV8599693.1 hypothetical protein [Actinomycetota bacterium]
MDDGVNVPPFLRGIGVIAAIAAVILILNLQTSLSVAQLLVSVAFFIAMAVAAYMFWRDFGRREIGLWPARQQGIFYGAIGLFVVDVGWFLSVHPSGRDALVFFVVAGACVYAAVRVWREQRRYS